MHYRYIAILILLFACTKENVTPTAVVPDAFDPSMALLIKTGSMNGVGHSVSGTAAIYTVNGKAIVLLDPFTSQSGPDLRVYASKDANASSYVSLGKLKSTQGKQSYELPANLDVADYHYILIWCEQFTVVFGRAELK